MVKSASKLIPRKKNSSGNPQEVDESAAGSSFVYGVFSFVLYVLQFCNMSLLQQLPITLDRCVAWRCHDGR